MVVRIRLARHGQRNRAFFRIVSADSRSRRDGRFLEVLGYYDPLAHSAQEGAAGIKRVALNVPRIKYWLSVGAQPSDTVGRLLGASGLLGRHPKSYRDPPADAGDADAGDADAGDADAGSALADGGSGALAATAPARRGLGVALLDDAVGGTDVVERTAPPRP